VIGRGAAPGLGLLPLILVAALARPAAAEEVHLLVVTGVEGEPAYGDTFHRWAMAIVDAATKNGAVSDSNLVYLAEKPERDAPRIRARSTRENVERALSDMAARARPGDTVFVVLIGHGSFDGQLGSFNLPGPDLTAADYARLLGRFAAQSVVFVNTASSSGAFLAPLAGPGRTIVTATRTGGERNDTRFPEYFVEALNTTAADRNRDGRISVLEAFEYARTKVAEAYEQEGLVLTEHATLEDGNGGSLAATLALAPAHPPSAAPASIADPAVRALVEERQAIEDQLAGLKLRKNRMDPARYEEELERLLTELARKTRAIRQMDEPK
jgi:hypothetical protein